MDYYNDSNIPVNGQVLDATIIKAEFDLISAAFVKVAPYTGNGGKIVAINAGGTAQEATSTPNIGTPSAGTLTNCTGLPITGLVASTGSALGIGSLELGHATDTTLTRVSAGVVAIEGVNILTTATGAALAGSASQAFAALAVNTSKTTVASATTPDIFAVTTGQLIDYTGTATCTGFVAASQAGMFRELYCAGACLFTAGANLLIEGIPSGTTITLAAGALVQVRSITTTQFKITYSVSGTFTATGTGFVANPTTTAKFSVCNGVVKLSIPINTLTGTSNATTFTITGAPACIKPAVSKNAGVGTALDNSVGIYVVYTVDVTAGTIYLYTNPSSGAWTASGTKWLIQSEFSYLIA